MIFSRENSHFHLDTSTLNAVFFLAILTIILKDSSRKAWDLPGYNPSTGNA
ncbi:unknown protein [Desulfotalea psychrophila LSv54]|uniref:Uncharacterized protein n=1 Tax=Desulfotalea psychrophila (strain LSv54 / DSM 12343) TaxID=177439 RepID=Q6AIU2_DESPS|nr:unknown protein [Desulfotalea psychrophila LSv54]